jgi:hemoglobin
VEPQPGAGERPHGADVGITTAVDEFYTRVVADPEFAEFFSGSTWTGCARTSGNVVGPPPARYNGRDMETAHDGLAITEAHVDRVIEHLGATLTDVGVDDQSIGDMGAALTPLRPAIVSL